MSANEHYSVVVVGGGTGGITVAARLLRARPDLDIAIVEPSEKHYYQPLWTLVGGGEFKKEVTEHDEASVIPKGVRWIRDAVESFQPEANLVTLRSGETVGYDFLVVAAGLKLDWDRVKGLHETLGRNGVSSNYSFDYVDKTWENIQKLKRGTAIFTQPSTPIKCGGAPQKIMYLADDALRRTGVRDLVKIEFYSGQPAIFHVPYYVPGLERVVARKGIRTFYRWDLVEVRGEAHEAVFRNLDTGEEVVRHFDMLHVTPPQAPPDFIRESPLANSDGWVDVDKGTTQHTRYANVFSLGDASSLPTSKTGAAIRKQAPILVENLVAAIDGKAVLAQYDGYTSCPLVTGYGRLIMAEFDYDKNPEETFPFDQRKERWSMYQVKKWLLPFVYWRMMLKGRV